MHNSVLAFTLLLGSLTLYAAETVAPYDEVKRAFNIIQKTQLEIFTEEKPPSFDSLIDSLDHHLRATGEETSKLELMRSALSDAIDSYNDQYANYISPQALQRYQERRSGSYHGIGLKFRALPDDFPVIIGPLTGGPLEKSNLRPGDQIIAAGDTPLKHKNSNQIAQLMKGPAGTSVVLSLQRGSLKFKLDAIRRPVKLEYAHAEIIDENIGYLKISRFGGNTHKQVRDLVKELITKRIVGIVLDLRDNPGGSTRAARSVTSIFVRDKYIYCERYKSGERRLLPRHGEYLTDLPLAILVNGNSMSSSEIVAGALQAYGRGSVIGEPTFGKGLVQKVFNLSLPLGGAIRTTIAEFATPLNQPIHASGIVPDKFVRTDADFMFRRTGSLNIDKAARDYQRTLLEERVRKEYPDKADKFITASDAQLATAINLIRQH